MLVFSTKKRSPIFQVSSQTPTKKKQTHAMSSLPPIDLVRGALMALELPTTGSVEDMHARLGAHLVAKMLGTSQPDTSSATASFKANGKRPCTGEPREKKKRKPSQWVQFLATERKKAAEAMPTATRAEVVRECARRWALFKTVNTSSAPLMLTCAADSDETSSESADLMATLSMELSSDEVKASLQAAGLEASDDDHEANIQRLAASMLLK